MKSLTLLPILLAGFLGWPEIHAAPPVETPMLPPGPLVQKRAPEFARWTIFSKSIPKAGDSNDAASVAGSKDSSPNGNPKFSVTKTGKVIRVIFFEDSKLPWNIWCLESTVVAVWPDGKNVGFAARPTRPDAFNPLYMDFSKSDFQGFDWVSEKNYTGIKDVMGRKCLVFQDRLKQIPPEMRSDDPEMAAISESAAVAAVDLETRLPVSLVNESGVFVYQFHDAPTVVQTVPENVQGLIDQQKQAAKASARRPSKPF